MKTILVGFIETGYILWDPESGRIIISRLVEFNEKLVYEDIYKTNEKVGLQILDGMENNLENEIEENSPIVEEIAKLTPNVELEKRPTIKSPKRKIADKNVDQVPPRKQLRRKAKKIS